MANSYLPVWILTTTLAGAWPQAADRPLAPYLMDEAREIALARSAAPASVSADAGVFVLGPDGLARAAESKNGFECMVLRGFNDQGPRTRATASPPEILGPICYGPEAARTELPLQIAKTALVARGLPAEEIRERLAADLAAGRLRTTDRFAIAYMFSSAQWFGPELKHFHPHVMIWTPGLDAKDIGELGAGPLPQLTDPGAAYALLAIPVPNWVDPVLPGGRQGGDPGDPPVLAPVREIRR
ncbi:MAG: hypothetical protein R2752_19165 [Vicinamibacterales bacterium]